MSKRTDQVKSGYASLDFSEREEVKKFINEYDASTTQRRETFTEDLNRTLNKSVGPRDSNVCTCCGK